MTINNLNKFVDQQGTVRAKAQFRLVLVKTGIRPSLTPALRLGLAGTRPTGALALMGTAT